MHVKPSFWRFSLPALILILPLAVVGRSAYRSHLRNSLFSAVDRGDAQAVRALLDRGVDPNAVDHSSSSAWRGYSVLHRACKVGNVEVANSLIDRGADLNAGSADDGMTPLMSALQLRKLDVARLLVERGADVNARGGRGYLTAVSMAWSLPAEERRVFYRLLIEHGAHVSLTEAVRYRDATRVSAMLREGIDPDEAAVAVQGPLYAAASSGYPEIASLLLDAGADVNRRGLQGDTPLIAAVRTRSVPFVRLLLRRGADVNVRSFPGDTALGIARRARSDQIVRMLEARGAREDVRPRSGR
jgi:ankyrin repeat protein